MIPERNVTRNRALSLPEYFASGPGFRKQEAFMSRRSSTTWGFFIPGDIRYAYYSRTAICVGARVSSRIWISAGTGGRAEVFTG